MTSHLHSNILSRIGNRIVMTLLIDRFFYGSSKILFCGLQMLFINNNNKENYMRNLFLCSVRDDMRAVIFIGFLFIMALQNGSSGTLTNLLSSHSNDIQQAIAQQPFTNSSVVNKYTSDQTKPERIMEASGHFANNQIKDGVVTWIEGGYWNLQINNDTNDDDDEDKNQTSAGNYTANFLANFTMIKPDGSLSHNHLIKNFSSNNVFLTGNDIVVTGVADILSDNGLEYDQVPLIVHLMGKKVLGLTIDVGKTEGHFSGSNEMFGTLISGVGIDVSNSNKTMMGSEEAMANETAGKPPMAMMHH